MRVHELAKELGVSSRELMTKLGTLGVETKTHMTMLDETTVAVIRDEFDPALAAAAQYEAVHPDLANRSPLDTEPIHRPVVDRGPVRPKARPAQAKQAAPRKEHKPEPVPAPVVSPEPKTLPTISFRGHIIVRELAEKMGVRPHQLIAELMSMNLMVSINQRLDINLAKKIADKHGFLIEYEKKPENIAPEKKDPDSDKVESRPEDLQIRPPVVTFMGHVDHGKTSLMDRIRNTKVVASEHGGITQHIGAYSVEVNGKHITFLDTPGHAAFTAMRARGANLTDIAVIVIAGDDGIMPQTKEAIMHAKSAKVAMMVAINKVDLPSCNPEKVKQQLQAEGINPEDWGGETICVPVSATKGQGVDHLLEMILLQADVLDLKANPSKRAKGFVVESSLEPGMGPVATLLVTDGTLNVGDTIYCEPYWGRVRALINDRGNKVKSAGPSTPVRCMGLSGVPASGAAFRVMSDDKQARDLAETAHQEHRIARQPIKAKTSLETLFQHIQDNIRLDLRLIIKADTHGSIEAIVHTLNEIKSEKISLQIVLSGTGNITSNDVMLASASEAIIVGFHVSKEPNVESLSKHEGVEIRIHNIIYELADEVRAAMEGMLKPEIREKFMGRAEIRQVFSLGKTSRVAGCMIVKGTVTSRSRVRVQRGTEVLFTGQMSSLKHFQNDVAEVREGQECGIRIERFNDFKEGDTLEFFTQEEIKQDL